MIVIKYRDGFPEGFNARKFWFGKSSFTYYGENSAHSETISLDKVKEIIVDGTTIWQWEAV